MIAKACAETRGGDLLVVCECGAVRPARSKHGQVDTPAREPLRFWLFLLWHYDHGVRMAAPTISLWQELIEAHGIIRVQAAEVREIDVSIRVAMGAAPGRGSFGPN